MGHELWIELYAAIFARSQHEVLWRAMASLPDMEKAAIDNKAASIIERFIGDLAGAPVKRWRVIENEWNKRCAPWNGAVGIEEVDDDLAVPAIVCWFTRPNGERRARRIVDLHNSSLGK